MTSVISKLAEVDPVFREVVSKLYPAVDPRELWDLSKGMPDQSAVNAPGQKKDNKKKLAAGLLFGTAAEGMAVRGAARHAFGSPKTPHVPAHRAAPGKVVGALKSVKAAHGPKAEFALQAANMAIGVGAARELLKKPKKQGISKAEFMELCEPIIKARRDGVITTETALDMLQEVEKGIRPVHMATLPLQGLGHLATGTTFAAGRGAAKAVKAAHVPRTAASKARIRETNAKEADTFRSSVNESVGNGRKAVGGAAAVVAVGAGVKAGKKHERNKLAMGVSKADQSDYEFTGEISKMDEDKRQVFGWCSLSTVDGQPVVDLQNDYISIEEIEKSAYNYVRTSRKGGDMHARVADEPVHTSDMIESVIITPDKLKKMGVPEEAISKVHTGWWVGFQVNDEDQWQKVKNSERTGFSIHGKGARVEKMLDE